MENLIPVARTIYNDYFEGAQSSAVYLLEGLDAVNAWKSDVDLNAKSYFDLPDNNWIVTATSVILGGWIDAYNNNCNEAVSDILKISMEWKEEDVIRFFVKNNIVFQTTWGVFLNIWDSFLAAEDDCPIVMLKDGAKKLAILFVPSGSFSKITGK